MRAALLADAANTKAVNGPELTALCNAIANTVVAHVVAAAVVTIPPGVPVATAGGPAAQTGATTAPAVGTVS
jgi:hypothetical protein